MPPHIARLNDRGLIELLDARDGRLLGVQYSHEDLLKSKWDRLIKIDTPQGPVWLEKGLNYDIIGHMKVVPYSALLGDLLCQAIANGATMTVAAQKLNLEYATVARWRRENETFAEQLKQARIDRAESFHDEAIEVARKSRDSKVQIETAKWAAEKNDPDKFGNKTKLVGDASQPITFIIDTGIRRKGDAGYTAPTAETPQGLPDAAPAEREAEKVEEPGVGSI